MIRGIMLAPAAAWAILVVAFLVWFVLANLNLSFTVRRLHDLDFSGWFILL